MFAGLVDPTLDSQRIFRTVLDAMAHPGRVVTVSGPTEMPSPLHPATAAVCLSLLDFETSLWLDAEAATPDVVAYLRFHCGVPIVDTPAAARFALLTSGVDMPALSAFDAGTDEAPDRSTTLIVQVTDLVAGVGRRLTGPGIEGVSRLGVEGLPEQFWGGLRGNAARFPCGVDLILTAGARLAALPRTTRVEG